MRKTIIYSLFCVFLALALGLAVELVWGPAVTCAVLAVGSLLLLMAPEPIKPGTATEGEATRK